MEKKRFAVLLCAEDSDYVKKMYGGYFGVFVSFLGEEGEGWDVFRVAKGELPGESDIGKYDGFVITGSCSDAHSEEAWIMNLVELLKRLDLMKKKVLGFCFGHQILGRAMGGKTGRASNGWDIGVTCIHPSKSTIKLLSSLRIPTRIPSHLPLIEFHRDEILELPAHAELMASSENTGIEMFRCGDHIMGIQGHPEYTKDILHHLIDRLLRCNIIQAEHAEAAKVNLDAREPDREAWKVLCRSFLKGKLFS